MAVVGLVAFLSVLTLLAYGGLTGRIRASSGCCAPADPRKDLRMRAAFDDEAEKKPRSGRDDRPNR